MDAASLIEPVSAAIVCGGTLLGTILRSGWTDCKATLGAVGGLVRGRFDADGAKAALAAQLREIQQDGILRAEPRPFGDIQFDEAIDLLVRTRSAPALRDAHDRRRESRARTTERAVRTMAQAAELAPVFGLAATLISLSQLPASGVGRHAYMGAISMSVAATLYGLLLANLILIPLGRAIERIASDEDFERNRIVSWLMEQIPSVLAEPKAVTLVEALAA